MADNNKKRRSSFRKLLPSLFFSQKSKDKNRDTKRPKNSNDNSSVRNHYQDPRSIIRTGKSTQGENENDGCTYENITICRNPQNNDSETLSSTAPSNVSSSSTLVSESLKCKTNTDSSPSTAEYSSLYTSYAARPQVPPKPHESHTPQKSNNFENSQYPDVYYHSVEKLTDKISNFDEIEIYTASRSQVDPTPVGAEIKKVSTKFLISPKKEAEVRTIQPTRARSLSFNKNKGNTNSIEIRDISGSSELKISKPYNYSAPTSPIPLNHKIPNMPKTVSPYDHVRKTIMETEIKRNSLSRSSIQDKSTSSLCPEPSKARVQDAHKMNESEREKTRQKVEAFYWQKLREQKEKEDEYLLRQSVECQRNTPTSYRTYSNSNCSTPNSFTVEPRSFSLPRGQNLSSYGVAPLTYTNPFVTGAPERRTDTFILNRSSYKDPEVIYRHPEKIMASASSAGSPFVKQTSIFQRGSLTRDFRNVNQQPKRVSFEEHYLSKNALQVNDRSRSRPDSKTSKESNYVRSYPECSTNNSLLAKDLVKGPPRPPVRTTSVNRNFQVDNSKIIKHSESEIAQEAGSTAVNANPITKCISRDRQVGTYMSLAISEIRHST